MSTTQLLFLSLLLSVCYTGKERVFVCAFTYASMYPLYTHKSGCIYSCTNMHTHPETTLVKDSYRILIRWESVFSSHHVVLRSLTHQAWWQAPLSTGPSCQPLCLGIEMVIWRQSNFAAALWVCNHIHLLPALWLLDNRSYTVSSCSLPLIRKCLTSKSENKQRKKVALFHIYTLVVFVLFCFSGRNNWQLKSVLSTQSENVLQMFQALVTASLACKAQSVFLWMAGPGPLKEIKGGLSIYADQLARKSRPNKMWSHGTCSSMSVTAAPKLLLCLFVCFSFLLNFL